MFENFDWSIHSESTWFDRDFLSATMFSFPGILAAERWFYWIIALPKFLELCDDTALEVNIPILLM